MEPLDMRTALLSMVSLSIACMAIAGVLWRQARERFSGLSQVFAGFGLQAVGVFLIALRDVAPDLVTIGVSNILTVVGAWVVLAGLERLVGLRRRYLVDAILMLLFSAVFIYFSLQGVTLQLRALVSSGALCAVFVRGAWVMLAGVETRLRPLTRYVGLNFASLAVLYGVRLVFTSVVGVEGEFMNAGALEIVVMMLTGVAVVTMALLIVLMINSMLSAELQTQERLLATAFRASPSALVLSRLDGSAILEANEAFLALTGYAHDEVVGQTSRDLSLWNRWDDRDLVVSELRSGHPVRSREFEFRDRSAAVHTGMVSGEAVSVDGEEYMLLSIVDVTERKRIEEEVRELSLRDQLTGLYNRRGFFTLVEHAARGAARHGDRLHVVFIDCDGLKAMNDTYGHEHGDKALIATAETLRTVFRESDVIARVGGDEFVACVQDRDDTALRTVLSRLESSLIARREERLEHWLDLSWGTATLEPGSADSIDEVLARADERMYQHKSAKHAGAGTDPLA